MTCDISIQILVGKICRPIVESQSETPYRSLFAADRLPRGEEQRAEPRREPQVVGHRREGSRGEAGATAAAQEVFPDVATAVTTGERAHECLKYIS